MTVEKLKIQIPEILLDAHHALSYSKKGYPKNNLVDSNKFETKEERIRFVVSELFRVARASCHSPKLRQYEEWALRQLMASEDTGETPNPVRPLFLSAFSEIFTSSAKRASKSRWLPEPAYCLSRWACIVLSDVTKSKAELKSFPGLDSFLKAQCTMFERLAGGKDSYSRSICNSFHFILKQEPDLVSVYLKIVSKCPDNFFVTINFLSVFYTKTENEKLFNDVKDTFLGWYNDHILSSKVQRSCFELSAFTPILNTLSHEDFAAKFLGTATRMLKRSPEATMRVLCPLFGALSLDLSRYVSEILPAACSELRRDAARREVATTLISTLCERSSDVEKVKEITQGVMAYLLGKHGSIREFSDRIALLKTVKTLSPMTSLGDASRREVSEDLMGKIVTFLKKEAHAEVREAAFAVMGHYLSALSPKLPTDALNCLIEAVDGKGFNSNVVPAALETLVALCSTDTVHSVVISRCRPKLIKLIEEAAKRPKVGRHAALHAVCLLIMDTKNEEQTDEKAWIPAVCGPESFVNHRELTRQCGPAEARAHARLTEELAGRYVSRITREIDGFRPCFANMLHMFLHTSPSVRSIAVNSSKTVRSSLKSVYSQLLAQPLIDSLVELSGKDIGSSTVFVNWELVDVVPGLSEVVMAVGSCPDESIVHLLTVAAHHPLAQTSSRAHLGTWKQLESVWKRTGAGDAASFGGNVKPLRDFIFSANGLHFPLALMQRAAVLSLTTVASVAPTVFMGVFRAPLEGMLLAEDLLKVTREELDVFFTPEGQLSAKSLEEFKFAPTKGINVGKHSSVSAEDLEWEAQVRRDLEGKKGEKEVDEKTEALLAVESETRIRIQALYQEVKPGLLVLCALADNCPSFVHDSLIGTVLPCVEGLLKSPIIWKEAVEALWKLATCMGKYVRANSAEIARAITKIARVDDKLYADAKEAVLVQSVLSKLQKEVGLHHVPHTAIKQAAPTPPTSGRGRGAGRGAGRGEGGRGRGSGEGRGRGGAQPIPASNRRTIASALDYLSNASFTFVLPILRSAVLDSGKVTLVAAAVDVIAQHCHGGVNARDDGMGAPLRFPSKGVLTLLLSVLAEYPRFAAKVKSAVLHIAPTLIESEISPLLGDRGLLNPSAQVRLTCLQALSRVPSLLPPHSARLTARVWLCAHDSDELVAERAADLWDRIEFALDSKSSFSEMVSVLPHPKPHVRVANGLGMAGYLEQFPDQTEKVVQSLIRTFNEKKDTKIPGDFHSGPTVISRAPWRIGCAACLGACVDSYTEARVVNIFKFFTKTGLADPNSNVFDQVLKAGLKLIEVHGHDHINVLLPIFDSILSSGSKDRKNDKIREGAVVFLGTLARHLVTGEETGARMLKIVRALIDALRTPSFAVQKAVSRCLVPLMGNPNVDAEAEQFIKLLLKRLVDGKTFGERKGAAFGLAGVVKGLGIRCIKRFGLMDKLAKAASDQGNARAREGALLAYNHLFKAIGSKFEPYVVSILPQLLATFGDSSKDVRMATREATRTVMANLTGHGIKMILPQLLRALEDNKWRTKQEAIGMLGAMAFCAPKQLSSCLPTIVPNLIEVLADPHAKVQSAGEKALHDIGSVVKNPEIHSLVPQLLSAVCKPSAGSTTKALQGLIDTSFVNSIDAPSLAIIVPILSRGLRERQGAPKRMSAQIVGSMCSLIGDVKDIRPYSKELVAGLKAILVDPLPDVRAAASHALGSLHAGMGDFDEIAEWLMALLQSDTTKVQRSGAAQGLAELLASFGCDRLESLLPSLLAGTQHENPTVREGHVQLLVFLPRAFRTHFVIYLERILPIVLHALSDDKEPVRSVALQAGKVIVYMFGRSHTLLLLDRLESALSDANWRIRESAVHLTGDLLHGLGGQGGGGVVAETGLASFTSSLDEEVNEETERAIFEFLGIPRRDSVLSALYICRSDSAPSVAQIAWQVWKSVVTNTPRLLRELLPTLMDEIIRALSAEDEERQDAAGRALGELVKGTGDVILPLIMPILKEGLLSTDCDTRTGVCYGLSEVMASARKTHLTDFTQEIIPAVQMALCDDSQRVRSAAGEAFRMLSRNIGARAVDDLVPTMVRALSEGDDEARARTVEGLREILGASTNSLMVLNHLVPVLAQKPMTIFRVETLASLSPVLGRDVSRHVANIFKCLVDTISIEEDSEVADQIRESASKFMLEGVSQECVLPLLSAALEVLQSKSSTASERIACAHLVREFCSGTSCDFDDCVPMLLQGLFLMFVEKTVEAQTAGWGAMAAMSKSIGEEKMVAHITFVRSCIANITTMSIKGDILTEIPGFCLKKALDPVLPMFQRGLMYGSPDTREQAAAGLGDLVQLTSTAALRPYVIKITGPLIRVVGDRFPAPVKSAILNTLGLLLAKTGKFLKPFLPQLQTSFVKALHDESKMVRERAAAALATLMELSTRVDSLVTELDSTVRGKPDPEIRSSMLNALTGVLGQVGPKVGAAVLANVLNTLRDLITSDSDVVRVEASKCLGVLAKFIPDEDLDDVMDAEILEFSSEFHVRHGRVLAMTAVVNQVWSRVCDVYSEQVVTFATESLSDDNAEVRIVAARCAIAVLEALSSDGDIPEACGALLGALLDLGRDSMSAIRQACFGALTHLGEKRPVLCEEHVELVAPFLTVSVSDSNVAARLAANKAFYHFMQIHNTNELLDSYVETLDVETKQPVLNHCRKMKYI
eukprot:909304_1